MKTPPSAPRALQWYDYKALFYWGWGIEPRAQESKVKKAAVCILVLISSLLLISCVLAGEPTPVQGRPVYPYNIHILINDNGHLSGGIGDSGLYARGQSLPILWLKPISFNLNPEKRAQRKDYDPLKGWAFDTNDFQFRAYEASRIQVYVQYKGQLFWCEIPVSNHDQEIVISLPINALIKTIPNTPERITPIIRNLRS